MNKSIKQLIEQYLAADTKKKRTAAKGVITRWAHDRAKDSSPVLARAEIVKAVSEFPGLLDFWLTNRLDPKAFYQEGDRVMGWFDFNLQVFAESLPMHYSESAYHVSFYGRREEAMLWRLRGFEVAWALPVVRRSSELRVDFDVKESRRWADLGYALPCDLQWRWREGEEFFVSRSIISAGFWCAYRWWDGCKWWYYEKHPEWFSDDPLWGDYGLAPVWHPAPDEFSAVLGGTLPPR